MDLARTEMLVRLLTQHQEELFRYIFALVHHEQDARDVLQETCVALCRKFDEYDASRPFLAWAYGFAYMKVLKQRDANQRQSRLLSPDLIERLAHLREQHEPILQARLQALDGCLERLPAADRELVRLRYQSRAHIDEIAQRLGSSRRTLFRRLDRVRGVLFECINQRVAATQST